MDKNYQKRSLVVGLGFGQLYVDQLKKLGHTVVTVDADVSKGADFTNVDDALDFNYDYDTAHICLPNHLHREIAHHVGFNSRVVFVEKPGFEDAQWWHNMAQQNGEKKLIMTKNNQYRKIWPQLRAYIRQHPEQEIRINWINKDRVPNPGSWFTDKSKSFGGVSRDLMPHLLSMVCVLLPDDYHRLKLTQRTLEQRYTLQDMAQTDYGSIQKDGVYDVDDLCVLTYELPDSPIKLKLTADWKSNQEDDIAIHIGNCHTELGLCPDWCYKDMIAKTIEMDGYYDQWWWDQQMCEDVWIHEQITGETISNTGGFGASVYTQLMGR